MRGPQGPSGASDKQIRLNIYDVKSAGFGGASEPRVIDSLSYFSLDYYPGVDSAVFIPTLRGGSSTFPVYAYLVNEATGDTLSKVSTHSGESFRDVPSGNIVDNLPTEETTLSVYLWHGENPTVDTKEAWLFLYRD
jgi:hypothetical protein